MRRALIYTRVSRDDAGDGRSVERQREACRKLADLRGWTVVGEESDNSISAWSGKERPAWERTLAAVESGQVDVLVAWHIDRMTRSMLELERLILLSDRLGVGVATATGDIDLTTDVGRMVARILAAVARAEVERKAARQRLSNDQKAVLGLPFGTTRAFGYESDGITIRPTEADAIRGAAEGVLNGRTLSSIHREWQDRGFTVSRMGVREILLNPRCVGQRVHRGEVVGAAAWDPILDEGTFLAVRGVLLDPRRGGGKGRQPTTLLSGIAVCAVCGDRVKGSAVRGKPTYSCYPGNHAYVDRAEADNIVLGKVIARLSMPDALSLLTRDDGTAHARVMELRGRLDTLAEAFAAGSITAQQLTTGSEALRVMLEEAELELASVTPSSLAIDASNVQESVLALDLASQRTLVQAILPSIRVHRRPQGQRRAPVGVALECSYQGHAESPPESI